MPAGNKTGSGRMITRSAAEATNNNDAGDSPTSEIDAAVNHVYAINCPSISGPVDNSAATTAAASWISSDSKVDVFGSGKIWIPPLRAKNVQDRGRKGAFL